MSIMFELHVVLQVALKILFLAIGGGIAGFLRKLIFGAYLLASFRMCLFFHPLCVVDII